MKYVFSIIMTIIPVLVFSDACEEIREYCALCKIYSANRMITSQNMSDFYFYAGKHCAYEETIQFIDQD